MTLAPTTAPDWQTTHGLPRPWEAIWPEPTASFAGATSLAWRAVNPALADLCRCRIAMLLGDPSPAPRHGIGDEHDRQVAELSAWPTSPSFSEAERACLAFTEQFVMDVGSMTPDLVEPLAQRLGDRVATFVQALFLLDMDVRMGIVLPALFGGAPAAAGFSTTAAPAAPGTPEGEGAEAAVAEAQVNLWGAIESMLVWVARMGELDPVTSELVRLRGARFHRCRICQSRLSLAALEAVGDRSVLDQVDTYEASSLPEHQKVALRLTDAMVTQPAAGLDDTLVAAARARFSPAQAVEIVYDVARNATNKFAVALGVDAPAVAEGFELFDIDAAGQVVAAVDPDQLRALLGAPG